MEDLYLNVHDEWLIRMLRIHVYNLSDKHKGAHNEIQWAMIAGLRHRLIHDYDGTN